MCDDYQPKKVAVNKANNTELFKVQIAQYEFPTVHVQIKDANKALFSEQARRSYGAAFNVEDEDLWDELDERVATLPSLAGSNRRYTAATMRRLDNETLTFALEARPQPETLEFDVEHEAPIAKPVALPIA